MIKACDNSVLGTRTQGCRMEGTDGSTKLVRHLYDICFLFLFQNTKMDPRVVRPLSLLIDAFQGPTRLIQKRHDKQLDLQASQQRAEKNRDPNKTRLVRTKN